MKVKKHRLLQNIQPANSHSSCFLKTIAEIHAGYKDQTGSLSEVAMIHLLSYLRLWQARDLLTVIYRLLKPQGLLVIELPDLFKCARKALESENNPPDYLDAVRGLYVFDTAQIESHEMFSPYAFGWSTWHLKAELAGVGFSEVMLLDHCTHRPQPWRDTRSKQSTETS